MNGPVWSLRTLLLAVVITGLFLGALRYPYFACAEAATCVSLITLGFAVLAAIVRRGEARHFWLGFSLFGLGYLFFILRIDNVTDGGPFPWRLLSYLMHEDCFITDVADRRQRAIYLVGQTVFIPEYRENVARIGFSFFGILLGCVGGMSGQWLSRRNQQTEKPIQRSDPASRRIHAEEDVASSSVANATLQSRY